MKRPRIFWRRIHPRGLELDEGRFMEGALRPSLPLRIGNVIFYDPRYPPATEAPCPPSTKPAS